LAHILTRADLPITSLRDLIASTLLEINLQLPVALDDQVKSGSGLTFELILNLTGIIRHHGCPLESCLILVGWYEQETDSEKLRRILIAFDATLKSLTATDQAKSSKPLFQPSSIDYLLRCQSLFLSPTFKAMELDVQSVIAYNFAYTIVSLKANPTIIKAELVRLLSHRIRHCCESLDVANSFYMLMFELVWGNMNLLSEMVALDEGLRALEAYTRQQLPPPEAVTRSQSDKSPSDRVCRIAFMTTSPQISIGIGCLTHALVMEHHVLFPQDIIKVYCLFNPPPDLLDFYADTKVELVTVPNPNLATLLLNFRKQAQEDAIDALIVDNLFGSCVCALAARIAPIQFVLDVTFLYGCLESVDWWFLVSERYRADLGLKDVNSSVHKISKSTVTNVPAKLELSRSVRNSLPKCEVLFGVICRLTKVSDPFLNVAAEILRRVPGSRLLICGPGNANLIVQKFYALGMLERISITNDNVDLSIYGPAIDVLLDTFPFIGGLVTRDLKSYGVPVVTKKVSVFSTLIDNYHGSHCVVDTDQEYIDLATRLALDCEFRSQTGSISCEMAQNESGNAQTIIAIRQKLIELQTAQQF